MQERSCLLDTAELLTSLTKFLKTNDNSKETTWRRRKNGFLFSKDGIYFFVCWFSLFTCTMKSANILTHVLNEESYLLFWCWWSYNGKRFSEEKPAKLWDAYLLSVSLRGFSLPVYCESVIPLKVFKMYSKEKCHPLNKTG